MLFRFPGVVVVGAVKECVGRGYVPNRALPFSTSTSLSLNWNKPKKSGDKGPEKNYLRKMKSKTNNEDSSFDSLLDGLKESKAEPNTMDGNIMSLLTEFKSPMDNDGKQRATQRGLQDYQTEKRERKPFTLPLYVEPVKFADANSGPRLNVFDPVDIKIGASETLCLSEIYGMKNLEQVHQVQVRSFFENQMDLKHVPYPRKFPVDNEDYAHGEEDVSFKDHVLLDHLIKDFPAKGPVRHFMELVLTGLSNNPDYTVKEKRDFIKWYKEYFAQFDPDELQMTSDKAPEPETST